MLARFAREPTTNETLDLLRTFGDYADRIVISFLPAGTVGKPKQPVGNTCLFFVFSRACWVVEIPISPLKSWSTLSDDGIEFSMA